MTRFDYDQASIKFTPEKHVSKSNFLQRNGELLFWERKEKRGIESIDKSNNNLLGRKFLSLMLRRGRGFERDNGGCLLIFFFFEKISKWDE